MTDKTKTAVLPMGPSAAPGSVPPPPVPGSILLEVIDGPMDGTRCHLTGPHIVLGRNADNPLPLFRDALVSGTHARLNRTEDPTLLMLEDLRSANGTWFQKARLISPHPVPLGGSFLVGQSVIRCSAADGRADQVLGAEVMDGEQSRLLDLLSEELRQSYGAATMLACKERRNFVNERHFFVGLAMSCPDLPPFQRGRGPIPIDMLSQFLGSNSTWTGIEPWLEEPLHEILNYTTFFSVYLPLVPRLMVLLQQAESLAKERGRQHLTANDCLRAMFGQNNERPYQVFLRAGLRPEDLVTSLGQAPEGPLPKPRTDTSTGAMKIPDIGAVPAPVVPLTSAPSVDPAIAHHAQELARRLTGLSALYQLATPEDRRSAMQNLLNEQTAELGETRRHQLLEQLRHLFPLDPGSTHDTAEVENLCRQIQQLKHRVAELESSDQSVVGSGLPWHLVVEAGNLEGLSPVERPRVEFLRELLRFGIGVEGVIVGMVQDLTSQAAGNTGTIALPGHRMSLRAFIDDMAAGRPVRLDALHAYLADVESWFMAGLAAYNKAPEAWFEKFWSKASPNAIESRQREGWARKLGLQSAELWKEYKDAVRKITPEFVTQNIVYEARKIARERQAKISQGRH